MEELPFSVQLVSQFRQGYEPVLQQLLLVELMSSQQRNELYQQLSLQDLGQHFGQPEITAGMLWDGLRELAAQRQLSLPELAARAWAYLGRLDQLEPLVITSPGHEATALEAAVLAQQRAVLEFLIARPLGSDFLLRYALRKAISQGKLELLQWLGDIVPEGARRSPLSGGYYFFQDVPPGRLDIVEYMLSFYSDPVMLNRALLSIIASFRNDNQGRKIWEMDKLELVLSRLQQPDADITQELEEWSLLAYEQGDMEVADRLLSPLPQQERLKWLTWMAEEEGLHLDYLLEQGVAPNLILFKAAQQHLPQTVEAALDRGATNLTEALEAGAYSPAVVALLLARGATTDKFAFNPDFTVAHDYEQEDYDQNYLYQSDEGEPYDSEVEYELPPGAEDDDYEF